jgi:hypothetical protein
MVDGQFVSAKVERIVLAIKEYEPELEVKWIPPSARRAETEPAFAIIHNAPGNKPYVMFYVQKEEDFDERVLQRIIYNDQRATGTQQYSELEALEAAAAMVVKQEWLDEMEEAADIAAHVLRSPLNTYKVNDKLIIKEGIPFNVANPRDN